MKTIANINQKGGVGKTTFTVNIAYWLSIMGYRTLIVDLDPQSHATMFLGGTNSDGLYIDDLFVGNNSLNAIITKTYSAENIEIPNLFIARSRLKLAVVAEQISARLHREKLIHNKIKQLTNFDFVVIDCPPTLGVLAINGIYAADKFLIPIEFGRSSLEGIADLLKIIPEIKEEDYFLTNNRFLIVKNKYDSRTAITNRAIQEQLHLHESSGHIAKSIIRKCEAINQSQIGNGETIFTFDPNGIGAEDFKSLTNEIIPWSAL